MIIIIDYGMGNLRSVQKALDSVTYDEVVISDNPKDLNKAEKIVLPGVGAFGQGINNLDNKGMIPALKKNVIEKKKPFLGICLGMQLIVEKSYEKGEHKGLGWIPAQVVPFEPRPEYKIPHVGWNEIFLMNDSELLKGYLGDRTFYFVHSFYVKTESDKYVVAKCDYGGEFVAAIQKENIFATQFHPEKSQKNGLRLLKRFVDWNPVC